VAPGNPDDAARVGAGCPAVVKGYLAHLGTTELVARVIDAAIKSLVQQPLIKAVGFTGSLRGGRALFDLCARRVAPIPLFGELGLFNPLFSLPHAVVARGAANAAGWVGPLTMEAVRH
jgi:NADP-dependent aldehyde dehydrogenase